MSVCILPINKIQIALFYFFLLDDETLLFSLILRVTPTTRKPEQKSPPTTNSQNSVMRRIPITIEGDVPQCDTTSKSIPDQQPAAPKVVLPVLEPSVSSTNIAKQAQEAEKVVEEKDGHYFMKVIRE